MSSSSPQGNPPPQPTLPTTFSSSGHPEPIADGKRSLRQLEQSVKIRRIGDITNVESGPTTEYSDSCPLAILLPLPATFPLLAQVQEIPEVENALHTLKMQRLNEYKQAVYIAPMAKPSLQASDNNLFPLMDKVQDFLAGDAQVMLILGDSGAGKSTFNRYLEYQLWQDYKTGGRIPVFINLPALDRPDKKLLPEQLRVYDFSEEQIRELKQHRQLTSICDGYDESQLTSNLHTTNLLNRSGQWDAKLLITCRTQYLGPDYRDRFVPIVQAQYNRAASELYQEAVIAPFSRNQIEDYVERYIPLEPRTWVKQDYMDKLTTIPNLLDLVKNPFLLTLSLEALPNVVQGKTDLASLRVTRVELYDTFVEHWLGVNKRRLQNHKLKDSHREALDTLLADGFERNGITYQKELAAAIFQEQGGRPVVDYSHKRDRQTWKAQFFGLDPERVLLRDSSLLSRAGNQYRFVHRSILEYFLSCNVYAPASNSDEFAPQPFFDPNDPLQSIADHPLSERSLVTEPSIVQFLAERVQGNPPFKQHLLDLVELSKSDIQASQAAANAITILVKAGVRFHGADLRGIRIPGADLSGGQFDSVQLQESDLTAVNFTMCWIRQANLSNARMEEARFGELPDLEEEISVESCSYSPDGKSFAVGLLNGSISIYDTATWSRTRSFQGHSGAVSSLAYSPTDHRLLSGSWDKTVRLWNWQTGLCDLILEGHTKDVQAVAFSPCGKQVASASCDEMARLWDAQTGAVLFDLPDADYVTAVAYSPDGHHVATSGLDYWLRIFDTRSGLPGLVLEIESLRCLAYSPDGRQIVSGNERGQIQLWATDTDVPGPVWTGHGTSSVTNVMFSPNGQYIASSSHDDATVTLWNAQSGTLANIFTGHSGDVKCIAFSPIGPQLAVGCRSSIVQLWEVFSSGAGPDVHGSTDPVTALAYSPASRSLISCSRHGNVRQYDAVSGDLNIDMRCPFRDVRVKAFSPVGLQVATVDYPSNDVTIWSIMLTATIHTLCGHTNEVKCIVFSPCGRWIATGSDDKTIRLWDARSGSAGFVLVGHDHEIVSVAFSPSGRQVVSVGNLGPVRVWEVETGEVRLLACISGVYTKVYNTTKTDDGEVTVTVHEEGDITTASYSPTGLQIATNHMDGSIKLWDGQTGEYQSVLRHSNEWVLFEISTCGQWIAIADSREVSLWNFAPRETEKVVTGNRAVVKVRGSRGTTKWRRMAIVRGFSDNVTSIAWRPDTLEFATGCRDGSVRVWKLVHESGVWLVRLIWGSGYSALVATGANITAIVGLSIVNRHLLEQRGAKDDSSFEEDDSSSQENDSQ